MPLALAGKSNPVFLLVAELRLQSSKYGLAHLAGEQSLHPGSSSGSPYFEINHLGRQQLNVAVVAETAILFVPGRLRDQP